MTYQKSCSVAGAVDARGLHRLVRDHLQRRQHHEHGEREPFPGVGDGDGPQRGVGIGDQRADRQADEFEGSMQRADIGRVDDLPDQGDDDRRQHHRDQERRACRLEDRRAGVEQQGDAEADGQLQQHRRRRQLDLDPDRVGEAGVVDGFDVVARADLRSPTLCRAWSGRAASGW